MGCFLSLLDKNVEHINNGGNNKYVYHIVFETKEGVVYKYPITDLNNKFI